MPRAASTATKENTIDRPIADGLIEVLVQRAYDLRNTKLALYKQIQANRRSLRDLKEQGALTDDQAAWVDEFYVPKNMRSDIDEDGIVQGELED